MEMIDLSRLEPQETLNHTSKGNQLKWKCDGYWYKADPIELEFGYGIIPLADVNQGGDLLDRVVMIRRQIALELGTVVPIIRLRDNIQLNPNQYIIKIKGIQVTEKWIRNDRA